jgi:hypothetical protein
MAKSHAVASFPRFARYGNNVLMIWDDADPTTDAYLHAAILLGLGLATRGKRVGDQRDIDALRGIEGRMRTNSADWKRWRSTMRRFAGIPMASQTRYAKPSASSIFSSGRRRAP